jgi:hypothetical protein
MSDCSALRNASSVSMVSVNPAWRSLMVLADGNGPVRLGDDGELVIGPLTAETVPDETEVLRDELVAMLPRIPLASLLIEVDRRTGFTDLLVHAGGKQTRPPELNATSSAV